MSLSDDGTGEAVSSAPETPSGLKRDERLLRVSVFVRIMRRPELGAMAGLVVVVAFFLLTANASMFTLAGIMSWMVPAAQLGILAVAASLLMIAGEFDLSIGSMIAFAGMIFGACLVFWDIPLWLAIVVTLAMAACYGFINAQIVLWTGLPSFIVTLAFLFGLKGATLVGLKIITGLTLLGGVKEATEGNWLRMFFADNAFESSFMWMGSMGWIDTFKNGLPKAKGVPVEVLWLLVLTVVATFVLTRTRFGNWIFASGGDARAARTSGVPTGTVKTLLFMSTACAAALVAIITVLTVGTADTLRGNLKEFEAIIAAVIGGCLLTGGYGSAVGAVGGAVIFGMVKIGLTYTNFDLDYYLVFLSGMLLVAVLANNYIRRRVTAER